MPEIILKQEIKDELAEKLQRCFPKGVIEIEEKEGDKQNFIAQSLIYFTILNWFL